MISVALIGTGNVAWHFYNAFSHTDAIKVEQIYGRNKKALQTFAKITETTTDISKVKTCDVYIIAVDDTSIQSVSQYFKEKKGLVVHTSGSTSIEKLSHLERGGVFYPLQTLTKYQEVSFKGIPICVEANSNGDLNLLKTVARHISERVFELTSEQRKSIHLAAVFTNNFVNHLYHIGHQICNDIEVPFDILLPLIRETVTKLENLTPYDAQTGPARRSDQNTIKTQKALLTEKNQRMIYEAISRSIKETYGKEL